MVTFLGRKNAMDRQSGKSEIWQGKPAGAGVELKRDMKTFAKTVTTSLMLIYLAIVKYA